MGPTTSVRGISRSSEDTVEYFEYFYYCTRVLSLGPDSYAVRTVRIDRVPARRVSTCVYALVQYCSPWFDRLHPVKPGGRQAIQLIRIQQSPSLARRHMHITSAMQSSANHVLRGQGTVPVPVRCPLRISWCRSPKTLILLPCLAFAATANGTLQLNPWNLHQFHDMRICLGCSEAGIRLTSTLWGSPLALAG
jgi:hypothetical protein